jgi:hypothetical protein
VAMRVKADCAGVPLARGCAHEPRRRPRWTTRHRVSCQKHADNRPLLQQSSPNRGRVVQPGKRAAFAAASHLVRLTARHSIRTATGALRRSRCPTPGMFGPRRHHQSLRSFMSVSRPPGIHLGGFVRGRVPAVRRLHNPAKARVIRAAPT